MERRTTEEANKTFNDIKSMVGRGYTIRESCEKFGFNQVLYYRKLRRVKNKEAIEAKKDKVFDRKELKELHEDMKEQDEYKDYCEDEDNIMDQYLEKGISNFEIFDWHKELGKILDTNIPTFLLGESGVGKTEAVKQYCYYRKIPCLTIPCDFDVKIKDLLGVKEIQGDKIVYVPGPLDLFLHYKGKAVILFDEINRVDPSMLTPFHEVLNGGDGSKSFLNPLTLENIQVDHRIKFIFTGNPNNGKYHVEDICDALSNRMLVMDIPRVPMNTKLELLEKGDIELKTELINYLDTEGILELRQVKKLTQLVRILPLERCLDFVFVNPFLLNGDEDKAKEIKQAILTWVKVEGEEIDDDPDSLLNIGRYTGEGITYENT